MTTAVVAAGYLILAGLAYSGLATPLLGAASWSASVAGMVVFAWWLSLQLCPAAAWAVRLLQIGLGFLVAASSSIAWAGWLGHATLGVQLLVSGGLCAWALPRVSWSRRSGRDVPEPLVLGIAVVGVTACAVLSLNLLRYTPVDSDNMWYHLPMVAEWTHTGHTTPVDAVPAIARAYPGFREAISVFLSLPLGREHLAVPGILEMLILCAGIYVLLCHGLGRAATLAAAAAVYAVTTPQIVTGTAGNDLALGLGVVLSLTFGRLALNAVVAGQPWRGHVVYFGLALGMTASTKYSGPFLGSLAVLAVGFWALQLRVRLSRREWSRAFLVVAAAVLLPALPWYARNLWLFHNPLYPAQISVAGILIFPGPLTAAATRGVTLGWNLEPLIATRRFFVDAFGPLLPVLVLSLFSGMVAKGGRRAAAVPALLVLLKFVLFLQQPFSVPSFGYDYNMRYLLPWFVCVVVGAVAWIGGRTGSVAAGVLLIGGLVNMAGWTHWWLAAVVLAGLASLFSLGVRQRPGLLAPAMARVRAAASPRWVVCAAFLLLVPAAAGADRLKDSLQYDREYGYRDQSSSRGWGAVARFVHGQVSDARVLVTGDNRFFPFYGDRLTNRITLVVEASLETVDAIVQADGIDLVVCLNPIATREGLGAFTFASSVGPALVERFPSRYSVRYSSDGAYVLSVTKHP